MLQIPLAPTPAQIVNVSLANQACTLKIYQKFWGLFCDVLVNNKVIIQGVICQNLNLIVRSLYLGFVGDLMFFDTQGTSDPFFEDLAGTSGGRFFLLYLQTSDLPDDYGQGPFDPDSLTDIADFANAFPLVNVTPTGGGKAILNTPSAA